MYGIRFQTLEGAGPPPPVGETKGLEMDID